MNYLIISGSNHGTKTRIATRELESKLQAQLATEDNLTYLDLQELDLEFSDGRHPMDWQGDNAKVVEAILAADMIYIGTPIFQASIPGILKNIFDLLPQDALERKVVAVIVTAGSPRHYLVAEQQLFPILHYMKAVTLNKYLYIEAKDFAGEGIASDDIQLRLDNLIQDSQQLLTAYQAVWQAEDDAFGF